MINKYFKSLIIAIFSFTTISANALDPKLMVVAESAGYGTVAGALLGTATLAFGGNGRNIAKGASLGLYAGLIFGGYIITSYEMKKRGWGQEKQQEDYYPETDGNYGESSSVFREFDELYGQQDQDKMKGKNGSTELSFALPILNIKF